MSGAQRDLNLKEFTYNYNDKGLER